MRGARQQVGKLLLVLAGLLAVAGVAVVVSRRMGLAHLPGDLVVRGRHVTVLVPIVTSVVLSLLLTGLLWLLSTRRR